MITPTKYQYQFSPCSRYLHSTLQIACTFIKKYIQAFFWHCSQKADLQKRNIYKHRAEITADYSEMLEEILYSNEIIKALYNNWIRSSVSNIMFETECIQNISTFQFKANQQNSWSDITTSSMENIFDILFMDISFD